VKRPSAASGGPPVVGLAEIAMLAGVSKGRASELVGQPGFPTPTELALGKIWWREEVEAFLSAWRVSPSRRKASRLPGGWAQAQDYVARRLHQLGWEVMASVDYDHAWDLGISRTNDSYVPIEVKAISNPSSARGHFTVSRRIADLAQAGGVVAFVDMTREEPWPVYLAGARTVAILASARDASWREARGKDPQERGWPPKISRRLLEQMGTREWWALLDAEDPSRLPDSDPYLEQARRDAPRPLPGTAR
jgi:hypothetical protein